MPTYVFECIDCQIDPFEANVPIAERDAKSCGSCGNHLKRRIVFTGLTWSPTRNGGFS